MAEKDAVTLDVGGKAVVVTHPGKLLIPQAKLTKLELAEYYVAVADGALRGAGGRPCVLVRYPNGIDEEFFFQKRAPTNRPEWLEVAEIRFPSGRTAEEIVPREAAALAWMANLACLELHPHPVRAGDLEHPDELRVDLDPVPGVEWKQIREVARVVREVLADLGLTGWPKTSGSRGVHVLVRVQPRWSFDEVRRAALALAREVERRAPKLATTAWWKEERHGVFLDYNQNAKDRTVASAYSVRAKPDARVSAPVGWDELDTCDPADFTVRTMVKRFRSLGDPHAAIDAEPESLESLLELSARQEREGQGDAPWPPHYRKGAAEPKRAPPSKTAARASAKAPAKADARAKEATAAVASATATQKTATEAVVPAGAKPKSSRKPKLPLVEVGRAQREKDVIAGLERWKERHPKAAAHLEPADVLVDKMRGRSSLWYRVRVNLQHVPARDRPRQEPLDPDTSPE